MKFLILMSLVALGAASRNIPVPGPYGSTRYVDPEELLEKALQSALRPLGVAEVEVDSHWYRTNQFYVELSLFRNPGANFRSAVVQAITGDLGLSDATVTPRRSSRHSPRFDLTLNRETMVQRVQALTASVLSSGYTSLELEYSPYD